MRLFILAIAAGIGVLVGVALYVGQEIVNPGTPDSKLTARLTEQHEAVEASEKASAKIADTDKVVAEAVEPDSNDPRIDAYKAQLRTAQFPAGTSSFDSAALRKQLPDIFQFPEQQASPPPPIVVATVLTPAKTAHAVPEAGSSVGSSVVPDAPTSGSESQSGVRPDTPLIKQLTAPEHKPSVATATNPNVHVEVAPASEGRAARTRMIVSK